MRYFLNINLTIDTKRLILTYRKGFDTKSGHSFRFNTNLSLKIISLRCDTSVLNVWKSRKILLKISFMQI